MLAVLMVPLVVFGMAACGGSGSAPAPKAIMDKATPLVVRRQGFEPRTR